MSLPRQNFSEWLREEQHEAARQQEALRKFYQRERRGQPLRAWVREHWIAWYCIKIVFWFAVTWLLVIGALSL